LGHILHQPKSWVLTHDEYTLTPKETHALQSELDQLLQGVPLPQLLGEWDFYGRSFYVSPAVLIPRPETEVLVERAIDLASDRDQPLIVDIGTGSGAIAVTLAAECPEASLVATDISRSALKMAVKNAQRHHQDRIAFLQADLLQPFHTQFDLIYANLPYIPTATLETLPVSRWEPVLALDGGINGLDLIERLLTQARTRLAPGGAVLLEIESSLGKPSLHAAESAFPEAEIILRQDLACHDRLIEIRLS
jgi:release factor glutamine methyltransferase